MAQVSVEHLATSLEALMERRMGVGGRGLAAKLRRAGRRLPKHVRRDAQMIAEAVPVAQNPKLARQIDLARLEVAERRAAAFLRGYDRADRRRGAVLGMLGSLSFNLLALAALVITLLVWRGLV